jgi:hypothetical protein
LKSKFYFSVLKKFLAEFDFGKSSMTGKRRQQVEAIVQSAVDIELSDERVRFVTDACTGDEELRCDVSPG